MLQLLIILIVAAIGSIVFVGGAMGAVLVFAAVARAIAQGVRRG